MQMRTMILLVALGIVAAFAALNWDAFMALTTLSFGFTEVQAPLGLIMLAMIAFITVLFLVFVVYMQTTVLLEARRHARELQSNRDLADKAETSRFNELRAHLDAELQKQAAREDELHAALLARLENLEQGLRSAVEESGNTLAAYIGEIEDQLQKK